VATLRSSLADLDVGWTETTADGLGEALAAVAERPAVGADLGDGLALPEWVDDDPTPADLEAAATGISPAAFVIADYGSLALRTGPGEPVSLYPETHVAVLRAGDVEPDMPAAMARFGPLARAEDAGVVLATGPSATADMGTLVIGAHGPRAVEAVVVRDE